MPETPDQNAAPEEPKEAAPEETDALVGKEFLDGQFRILAKIASGGMGAIYLAEQPSLHRKVAVKILHPELARRKDLIQRFHREARATSQLTHPNTIRTFLYGELPDGTLYIVMEYLEGANLLQILRRTGPLPIDQAVGMVAQVAAALDEAHTRGIIHRDLKSENIFLTRSAGQEHFAKILDFGIATLRQGDEATAGLTAAGSVFGTPQYMSPEQARGRELDGRSDLYSLGIIFYEALTGKLPWNAKTPMDFITCHLADDPLPMREQAREVSVPQEIEEVIRRLLRKKPEERYASGAELGRALVDAWARAARRGALPPEIPAPLTAPVFAGPPPAEVAVISKPSGKQAAIVPRPPLRRLLPATGALVALGLSGALLVYLLTPAPPPPAATLTVVYAPPETKLSLNGKTIEGKSPYTLSNLAPGDYTLSGEADGFFPKQASITLNAGETGVIELRLEPIPPKLASLSISGEPKEAEIILDGVLREKLPFIHSDLTPGPHELEIVCEGFIPYRQSIDLAPGDKKLLTFSLIPERVSLRVSTNPPRASLAVFDLDDPDNQIKVPRKTPVRIRNLHGGHRYRLEISHKGYEPLSRVISFDPTKDLNEQLSLTFTLTEEEPPGVPRISAEQATSRDKKLALDAARDLVAALDRDRSGGLSPAESQYIPGLLFEDADKDKDTSLSAQEIADYGPKAWGMLEKPPRAGFRMLQLAFAQKLDDLSACTEQADSVLVEISVGADGSVRGARTRTPRLAGKEDGRCIERVIKRMIFLPPGRSLSIAYDIPL